MVRSNIIGRAQEIRALAKLLKQHRLVTITGPGGVGKSRLALHILEAYPPVARQLIHRVELAPVSDGALLPEAISSALGLADPVDENRISGIVTALRNQRALLLLDNCEHLGSAVAELVRLLLTSCPWLTVLTTSRATLGLSEEQTFPLGPLRIPSAQNGEDLAALLACPSVALFLERARTVAPGFQVSSANAHTVALLCQRLEGLPLAIELAAARMRILDPAGVLSRLDEHFERILKDPEQSSERHLSLQIALDWSYDLLTEVEAILLRRLAVFAGGWTYDAAEVVSVDESLTRGDLLDAMDTLLAQSFIQAERTAHEIRYRMLEPIRQYALEILHRHGELEALASRHLLWCVDLSVQAAPAMLGGHQGEWYDRLEREIGNIRAALTFGCTNPRSASAALTVATALYRFWHVRGHMVEARQWLERLLELDKAETSLRVSAICLLLSLLQQQGDFRTARQRMDEVLPLAPLAPDIFSQSLLLTGHAELIRIEGDVTGAVALGIQGVELARSSGDQIALYHQLYLYSNTLDSANRHNDAVEALEEALTLIRAHDDVWLASITLHRLALLCLLRNDAERAQALMIESLEYRLRQKDPIGVAHCLETAAWIAARRGLAVRSAQLLGASDALREKAGGALFSFELAGHGATIEALKEQLGEVTFESEWATGRGLTAEAATGLVTHPTRSRGLSGAAREGQADIAGTLTLREYEVASLIGQGLTNAQIAQALTLSVRTVERHVENIYGKIGARGKAGRALIARLVVARDRSPASASGTDVTSNPDSTLSRTPTSSTELP